MDKLCEILLPLFFLKKDLNEIYQSLYITLKWFSFCKEYKSQNLTKFVILIRKTFDKHKRTFQVNTFFYVS